MSHARWSFDKAARRFSVRLIASSALALAATLASIPVLDGSSAQGAMLPGATSGKGGKPFGATRAFGPRIKHPPLVSSSSAGARVTPPPKGRPSKGPRGKPPIIVKRYPIPPVVPPVVLGNAGSAGGSPGPGAGPQPLRPPGGLPPRIGAPAANEPDYVPDEVVIELAANTTDQAAEALARRFRLTQLDSFEIQAAGTRLYRWRITDRRPVPEVVRAIGGDRSVLSVTPNFIMRLYGGASAPAGGAPLEQYALAKLQLPQAHALAQGGDVLIAIIDSGVDVSHPELKGVIAETFVAVRSGEKAHPHGTAVAGAIAAQARLKGTAPAARILAAQAFDRGQDRTEGDGFTVAKAVYWAVDRGARIINMSFAGSLDPSIEKSLRYARQKGVVLVAAAGNKGPLSAPLFPAANPNVIAVTATDANDKVFQAANRGKHIAVAAPGVELLLPGLEGTYQEISGTSFAAAEVSGTIALLIERKPDLTHDDIRRILMSTARDLGAPGFDPHFGAGLVDAYRAVLSIAPAVAASPASGVAEEF